MPADEKRKEDVNRRSHQEGERNVERRLLLATITGTVFSALTVNIRLREVMLPILNFPILIPALLAAMQLTKDLVAGVAITPATDTVPV